MGKNSRCFVCGEKENKTDSAFIDEIKSIHGDNFDYSKTSFVKTNELATVICKNHGEMRIKTSRLLDGDGCLICYREELKLRQKSIDWFIRKSKVIHGNKYSYDKFEYLGYDSRSLLNCPKHGAFLVSPYNHLVMKLGCRSCEKKNRFKKVSLCNMRFSKDASLIHSGKYTYRINKCVSPESLVSLICNAHGETKLKAKDILSGYGCYQCERKEEPFIERIALKLKSIIG